MTLDAGLALDLLSAAVWRQGPATTRRDTDEPSIIEAVFRALPASAACIDRVRHRDLRSLYLNGLLPEGTTIGAVIVLRRAQLAERTGAPWGVVLERAIDAAQSVLDLAPAHLTSNESVDVRRSCRHGSAPLPHHHRARARPTWSTGAVGRPKPSRRRVPSVADDVASPHLDGELP